MLSDRTIKALLADQGRGELDIYCPGGIKNEQFQPASVDLRIGLIKGAVVDKYDAEGVAVAWRIPPRGFCLGSTIEFVRLGANLCGRVEGKSSWARRGLMIHCAGFVDPGFEGQLTLEIFNFTEKTIVVEAEKRIAQICFDWLNTTPERLYGDPALRSRYQGQIGPTPARGWSEA